MSTPSGVAASVKQRLLNKARSERLDFQLLLTRYFLERLLYRLSRSAHAESFTLKGAMLFHVWGLPQTRPTRDLDLLGQGTPSTERLAEVFGEICEADSEDDGVRLDAESISAQPIAEQAAYLGVRVSVTAHLGSARLPLQIDVGFGDSIVPTPVLSEYPTLLDQPAPRIRCYRPETAVAEKTHAMLTLGIGNSRMKDFFDVDSIAGVFAFQGPELADAIAATFARRNTSPPAHGARRAVEVFRAAPHPARTWNTRGVAPRGAVCWTAVAGVVRGDLQSPSMSTPTDLLNQALTLSREERASLARELIASLDEPHEDPAAVEAAWLPEIERRVQEVRDGTAELVDWESVRDEALERLRER